MGGSRDRRWGRDCTLGRKHVEGTPGRDERGGRRRARVQLRPREHFERVMIVVVPRNRLGRAGCELTE